MSKKTSAVPAVNANDSTPLSLKDAAYRQAKTEDVTRSLAKYVMQNVPSFPESISDEAKAEIYSGYQMRFSENNPDTEYVVVGGNYVRAEDLAEIPEKAERINVGVGYVMSFTQQAFGSMANAKSPSYNPALHGLLKTLRDKISKYCSNTYKKLVKVVLEIQNEGKPRTRTQADAFSTYLDKTFDTMQKRCRTAKTQRGDDTANFERFTKAKVAFMAVWNHAE
jgi:hypothetical protein